MKKSVLLIILLCTVVLGYGQRSIKKHQVEEIGYHKNVVLKPLNNSLIHNGLEVKINPISADDLNAQFNKEVNIDGKFDYAVYTKSRQTYFLKKRGRKREKSDFEFYLEGIEWLLENNSINQTQYNELYSQIIKTYSPDAFANFNTAISYNNPYHINGKYLNVFEIELYNPTDNFITLKEELIIQNGNKTYNALPSNEIVEPLTRSGSINANKGQLLQRHNLKYNTTIPPKSTVKKLFATLPIDFKADYLNIYLMGSEGKMQWEVVQTITTLDENYSYFEFNVDMSCEGYSIEDRQSFSVLTNKPSNIFLNQGQLFIEEKELDTDFQIIGITIYNDEFYFGGIPLKKGSAFLDIAKGRRETISLRLSAITDLEKKVKR
ncbi:MAG: hypothetical protein ACPGLV_09155 [Bacteroidia bacterium]